MTTTLLKIADLHRQLGQLYQELAAQQATSPATSDRVLSLAEAAHRLGCTVSWLSRRSSWTRVGGYKDVDGRVKFTETRLRAHLEAAATNGNR